MHDPNQYPIPTDDLIIVSPHQFNPNLIDCVLITKAIIDAKATLGTLIIIVHLIQLIDVPIQLSSLEFTAIAYSMLRAIAVSSLITVITIRVSELIALSLASFFLHFS
jgi:hypothetical protein